MITDFPIIAVAIITPPMPKGRRRTCTIPAIFGLRDWFDKRFWDLCDYHDTAYKKRTGKWHSDMVFIGGMIIRGYWYLTIPTFIMFNTIGFWYYYT